MLALVGRQLDGRKGDGRMPAGEVLSCPLAQALTLAHAVSRAMRQRAAGRRLHFGSLARRAARRTATIERRAHCNVLNANEFWFPATSGAVAWADYFPQRAAESVEFIDIGCGFGSLLVALVARGVESGGQGGP